MSALRASVVVAFVLLACLAIVSADTCSLTIQQPGLFCSASKVPCQATANTFPYPLPAGETYDSFYKWILGVLGTNGADVKTKWVDTNAVDPNLFFQDSGATGCYVNITFVYEVASYRNKMGYFAFNKNSRPTSTGSVSRQAVFADATVDCIASGGGSCLPPGSTVTVGPFTGSQGVGFYLQQNGVCTSTGPVFYSVDALNSPTDRWRPIPRAAGRLVAVLRDPNTQRVYLGWEDFPNGGDSDYNDNVFSLTSNCPIDYTKIPCGSDTTTGCRNTNQRFNVTSCTCACPGSRTCTAPQVYSDELCSCVCPNATQTCTSPKTFNSNTCQCDCPSTGTCPNEQKWNSSPSVCGCQCPDPSTYQCSTVVSGTRFVLNSTSCTCNCPASPASPCGGNLKWNPAPSSCSCYCPSSAAAAGQTCIGNQRWNTTAGVCACTCPATAAAAGVTCKDKEIWDTTTCTCKCPDTPAAAGVSSCPNTNYVWNYQQTKCDCVCPPTPTTACAGQTQWDTTVCNCTCPATGACDKNKAWVSDPNPDVCGCHCPATAPKGKECTGNFVWNKTEEVCDCFCPYEPPVDDPCVGNTYWNRTECDCFCPYEPPSGSCPGVQTWDRDLCQCVCPDDDPCEAQTTACQQFSCSDSTGECALVYEDTCASQILQFNTTGCLAWSCDPDLGCVRRANGSCCEDYKDCPTCAKYDGCDWIGTKCADSGQVLTSPVDQADHPDCFPSTGLSAGETAGITVGIVAGVTVGVGGAAGLFGAGYILYRMLNKPPPPEQLPTIENLDTEAGTDDNPLFHKNEIEMTNPMFSAGGGASAAPADLHAL